MARTAALFLMLWCWASSASALEVSLPDLGEGEAVLIQRGEVSILVDAGNPLGAAELLDFLKKQGATQPDAWILTHLHPDHMGGAFGLLKPLAGVARYDNGEPIAPAQEWRQWYARHFRQGNYRPLKAGDRLDFGEMSLNVLWPHKFGPNENANSLVLFVETPEARVLLMGDAGQSVEAKLLKAGLKGPLDLLKLGHHGAKDCCLKAFLEQLQPRQAALSIDQNNRLGYPAKETLDRLKRRGIPLKTTYEQGDLFYHWPEPGEP